ncbi:MAG: hypothetical protein QS721_13655 [Candidatus Endonucleobacter sp. (ex Gigantidas childressi)]|nr:hypothetical protein [Candidatus Endonucleobacter sp. (ex Gigantidas childressi)]
MLTTFYFDQELFSDESLNLPITNSVILETWSKYGCLAICQNNINGMRIAIDNIPIKYKQKWITALTSDKFKKTEINISDPLLSSLSGIKEFEMLFYTKNITTGILTIDYQELFEEKSLPVDNNTLEILSPTNINESINFNISKCISEKDIKSGDEFNDIWKNKFEGLAMYTSTITILDRYMALNIERDLRYGLKTSLELLIESLSKYEKKFTIHIFCACDTHSTNIDVDFTRIKSYINSFTNKPYFSKHKFEIELSLCKDKIFKTEAHDRMMCFDNHVIQIGKGMDIFRDKLINNNTFTIKSRYSTLFDDMYKELAKNREKVFKL